jgi:RNA polymerase sigma-70 factor (ECF subfamily)
MGSKPAQQTLTASDFRKLYEEHLTAVYNFCLYQVRDQALAEDLTADTFERAWRSRRQYDPARAAFTNWLFTIARNRVADRHRWQGRHTIVDLNGRHPDTAPLPEEIAARSEKSRRPNDLIADLTADQQELIALKFGAGLTNRVIAELLGKSETAVGSALHRALGSIRQQLSETEISDR